MKYYKTNGVRVAEVPVGDFRVRLIDANKRSITGNGCNAGFFGNYKEGGQPFTLPVGHLVCDVDTTGKWALHYCGQRGHISGKKLTLPSGTWDGAFYGKAATTLLLQGGRARMEELRTLPAGLDYAIPGVPILRGGAAVSMAEARAQGWDASSLYATRHVFLGLKDSGTVYAMGYKTRTGNLVSSGEAARLFKGMGFVDVLKLDGGGSYYFRAGGEVQATLGSRRICTALDFGGNPWPAPARTLVKGRKGDDVRWMQWELCRRGFPCDVDGSFGPGTKAALMACQVSLGLVPDGSCGPASRAALMK